MENEIKVSVIIPVYNVEPYLEQCLSSVRRQTLKEIEILCIDDCGTDHSREILQRTAAADVRVKLYKNSRNIGLAASRNRGMSFAGGKYLYFLDADDMIRPEALESLCMIAEQSDLEVEIFCAEFIYENESLKSAFSANPAVFKGTYPELITGRDLFVKWMKVWDWMPSQPRYFYRRDFLEKNEIHFIDGMLHEDELFAYEVLRYAKRVRVLRSAFFIRRFRTGSIMTGAVSIKNVDGCLKVLQQVTADKPSWGQDPELAEAVCFYRKKIAETTRRKYQALCESREGKAGYDPIISIVIPVYNAAPYLEKCLDSVCSQELLSIEIICVEDGSTDESPGVLEAYARMDPRLIILRNDTNLGQSVARNRGIAVARGTYVYMLDADDWIAPQTLQILYSLCEKEQLDVIGFENRQVAEDPAYEALAETVLFSYEKTQGLYSGKDAFISCVVNDTLSPSVPTFMIRRAYLENRGLRFQEHILHEDIGFIFELLLFAGKVQLLHRPLYYRRFRKHSTVTSAFSPDHARGYLKSWQKAFACGKQLRETYGDDPELKAAVQKWKRDVLGRIRMLYLTSEESYYAGPGEDSEDITDILVYTMLKETSSGRGRAQAILGTELCRELELAKMVYICGTGQYANRMIDLVGALNVEIKGVLSLRNDLTRRTMRGFQIISVKDVGDTDVPVVLGVSHYNLPQYEAALKKAGFVKLIHAAF